MFIATVTRLFKWLLKNGLGDILDTNKSSDWSVPSWLWYAGLAIISIGIIYVGYNLIYLPEFMDKITPSIFKVKHQLFILRLGPPNNPTITLTEARTTSVVI